MAETTISLAGTDIHYAELGGSGPPLLLLHGITDSLESYLPAAPKLTQGARVFAVDFRGHGRSAHTPDRYRLRDYATDVRLLLDQVVREPAAVAGHSLGGLVASYLASRPDASLRGVFLEDAPLFRARLPALKETSFYGFFVALRGLLRAHHASGASLEELAHSVGNAPLDAAQPDGATFLEARGEEGVRLRARQLRQMDPDALSFAIEGTLFDDFDPDRDLAKIACPVHLLAGNEALGGAMTAGDVALASAHIARCTTAVWDDLGHLIHHLRPEAYADELLAFLRRTG